MGMRQRINNVCVRSCPVSHLRSFDRPMDKEKMTWVEAIAWCAESEANVARDSAGDYCRILANGMPQYRQAPVEGAPKKYWPKWRDGSYAFHRLAEPYTKAQSMRNGGE